MADELKPGARQPSFIAVDFFCGAGGTTRGLIDAGGHVIAGVDKVAECKETFERNNINPDGSQAAYLQRDIFRQSEDYPTGEQQLLMDELEAMIAPLRASMPGVPLMFSICAPCQPFTNMSKVIGEERATGRQRDRGLLGQSLDFIDRFKPELLLCENVAGIQAAKYGGVWQAYAAELEEAGYIVGSSIIDAVNYGIPQYRKRSIMLAVRRDAASPETLAGLDVLGRITVPDRDETVSVVTVKEAIGRLPALQHGGKHETIPNHQCGKMNELNRRRLEHAVPGGTNLDYNGTGLELACHTRMRAKSGMLKSGFTDSYTRLSGDRPSPTITTKCYSFTNGRFGHFDTTQVRALTVREAAALQSFDDDYVFHSKSLIRAARMVGNAVPPKLGRFFGERLVGMVSRSLASEPDIAQAA